MTDPCEDICDALVAEVNTAAFQTDLDLKFEAANPPSIKKELEREHADLKVFFAPYGEEEEKTDRGGVCLETCEVTMLVVRRIDESVTRQRLNGLVYSIRKKLRARKMAGRTWTGGETVTKTDPEQIDEIRQYASISRLRYVGMR
jgi:hypothetical protein